MSRKRETDGLPPAAGINEASSQAICEALELALNKPEGLDVAEAIIEDASYENLEGAVSSTALRSTPEVLANLLLRLAKRLLNPKVGRATELSRLALAVARDVALESVRQPLLAEAELALGDSLRREKDFLEAERAFARARLHVAAVGNRSLGARILLSLAELRDDQGLPEEAQELRQNAAGVFGELGDHVSQARAVFDIVEKELRRGDQAAARRHLERTLGPDDAAAYMTGVARTAATLVIIEVFWQYNTRGNVNPLVAAEMDYMEGRIRLFSSPRVAETRLADALDVFHGLGQNFEASKACLCLVVLYLYEDRPRAAGPYLEILGALSRSQGFFPHREALQEFCSSAATATFKEAHALLERIGMEREDE